MLAVNGISVKSTAAKKRTRLTYSEGLTGAMNSEGVGAGLEEVDAINPEAEETKRKRLKKVREKKLWWTDEMVNFVFASLFYNLIIAFCRQDGIYFIDDFSFTPDLFCQQP
jgi:surface antigen